MRETGGLEIASTITLVLQANRLTISKVLEENTWNFTQILHIYVLEMCEEQ